VLRRYWFSWKADGTRYMVYISNAGTFLVDRRMCVTRVQMRFPLWYRPDADTSDMRSWMDKFERGHLKSPSSLHHPDAQYGQSMRMHSGTLVDGEMVVNTLPDGTKRRVFYMYDLMMLNGYSLVGKPWKVRSLPPSLRASIALPLPVVLPVGLGLPPQQVRAQPVLVEWVRSSIHNDSNGALPHPMRLLCARAGAASPACGAA
jgi:hypothetical protein